MACKTIVLSIKDLPDPSYLNVWSWSTEHDRSVASMEITSITAPSTVEPGQIFTITCKYKLCARLYRNRGYEINPLPMERWPDYHGGLRRCAAGFPYACTQHEYVIWRLQNMALYLNNVAVANSYWNELDDTEKLEWSWTGTIEELTGRTFPESSWTIVRFRLDASVRGWHTHEWWPWNWPLELEWGKSFGVDSMDKRIDVYVPPPPPTPNHPVFNTDYCRVSKAEVAPNEKFDIQVRLVNQSEYGGAYEVSCLCEAKDLTLGTGTIAGNGTVNRTFSVTANQLAQRQITESQYLSFSIRAHNNLGQQTDQWNPAAIRVLVPINTGTLSGRVTDKTTGAGIAGVSVTTTGHTATTNSTGHYAIYNMQPGDYSIRFRKAGYYDETKAKTINVGGNTLDMSMTATTEPPPNGDGEIPWNIIALAGGLTAGAILIIAGVKGAKK